jgi:hypothetical protein
MAFTKDFSPEGYALRAGSANTPDLCLNYLGDCYILLEEVLGFFTKKKTSK